MNPVEVFEIVTVLSRCLEGFLYGMISVLCPLICMLLKKVQLFPGLGIYSAIFIIYLHCVLLSKESRKTSIIFYALCLLYVLSTATFVCDLLGNVISVSNNSISKDIIFLSVTIQLRLGTPPVPSQLLLIDSQSLLFRIAIVEPTVFGCCDFIAQFILVRINNYTYHLFYSPKSSKIYRCWIVWGKNIWVAIVPLFLAITYIGQWIYLHLISWFEFIASSYLASGKRRNNSCKWRLFNLYLGEHTVSNGFGRIHGGECPSDGLDRVQDPQGVLGG